MSGEQREFGSYRLLRRLGVGGMAETFEAVRRESGGFEQRVCLKRVLPAFSSDPSFVERFQREARLAASLRHSNVVGVTDFGVVDGVSYIALELVDGVDLRSFLKTLPEHRLDASLVACIGLDLAYALEHAHEHLVHRDVSPSNVLIGRSGEAKLADFGLAKPVGAAGVTSSGNVPGKVPYMSPEQIRGETVDARSDLFSLGVVLFEAVAGRRPFDGPHDVVTMQRIVEGKRLQLADVAPSVPASLTRCIDRLLEVNRDDRTPSATALVDAISEVEGSAHGQRQLASMVEAMRGGPSTRMHVRARQEEPDTELSPAAPLPPSSNAPAPKEATARTSRWWGAAALAAVLLVAIGSLVLRSTPRDTDGGAGLVESATEADAAPAEQAAAEPDAPEKAGSDTGETLPHADGPDEVTLGVPSAAEGKRPSADRGWVRVVVQPWGNVWIDGVWMGRAPVTARLPEGRHVVEVGRDLPAKKRVVRVAPGERRNVELSLAN